VIWKNQSPRFFFQALLPPPTLVPSPMNPLFPPIHTRQRRGQARVPHRRPNPAASGSAPAGNRAPSPLLPFTSWNVPFLEPTPCISTPPRRHLLLSAGWSDIDMLPPVPYPARHTILPPVSYWVLVDQVWYCLWICYFLAAKITAPGLTQLKQERKKLRKITTLKLPRP
jgi:hypothetical protein